MKRNFKRLFGLLIGTIFIVVVITVLPDMWFKRLLNRNHNIHEPDQKEQLSSRPPKRLCLIFALDVFLMML